MYGKITLGSLGTILVKLMIAIGNFGFSCVYYKVFGKIMYRMKPKGANHD